MTKNQRAKYGENYIFCVGDYKSAGNFFHLPKLSYYRGKDKISKEEYNRLEKISDWIADYSELKRIPILRTYFCRKTS